MFEPRGQSGLIHHISNLVFLLATFQVEYFWNGEWNLTRILYFLVSNPCLCLFASYKFLSWLRIVTSHLGYSCECILAYCYSPLENAFQGPDSLWVISPTCVDNPNLRRNNEDQLKAGLPLNVGLCRHSLMYLY